MAGEVHIEAMRESDYVAVHRLWRVCAGVGLSASDGRPAIKMFLARNPRLSLVARDAEGVVIGAVLCSHDGVRGYLRHLAVLPEHRRQGIGRALMRAGLARLKALGLRKCTIFQFRDNAAGEAFWEQSGWRERPDLKVLQVVLCEDEPIVPRDPRTAPD